MKYMLIDVTTLQSIRFLAVAETRETPLLGKIYKAQGLEVIAPPLEGRGFAKLTKEQAQYLLWNSTKIAPPDDLGECYRALHAFAEAIPCDKTPLETLEAEVLRLYPGEPVAAPQAPKEPRTPSVPREPRVAGERPKATSTTGRVWEIADRVYVEGTDWKTARTAIVAACIAEGINEATAATQYSKWKGSRMAAKAA